MPIEVNHFSSTDYISVGTQLTVRIPTTAPAFSLLLVDGNMSSLVRQQRMLSNSGYRVITATTCNEIMSLRRTAIQLAVLNETLGWPVLRGAAESVRRTWPSARILVLGAAQGALDDPLYDEAVDSQITTVNLLSVLRRLSCDSVVHVALRAGLKSDFVDFWPSSDANRMPALDESDPSKEADYESVPREEPRDLPAEERKSSRVADPQSAWLAHTVHAAALSTVRD